MLRRIVTALAATLALAALTDCSSTKKEEKPVELVKFKAHFVPKQVWTVGLGKSEPKLDLGLAPAIDGARVYGANAEGDVVALDLANGHNVWRKRLKMPLSGGTGAGGGMVLVCGTGGVLVALNESDGHERWRAQLSSEVLAAPVVAPDLVLVRTVDGKLFALEAADGKQRWVADQQVPRLTLRGTSKPVVAGELAISGFDNGRIVAAALGNGSTAWESPVGQSHGSSELQRLIDIDSPPAIDGDDVFAVAFQGRAVRLARDTGLDRSGRAGSSSYRGLAVDLKTGRLRIHRRRRRWCKLDRRTGAEQWRAEGSLERRQLSAPALHGGRVVVADFEGFMRTGSMPEDGRSGGALSKGQEAAASAIR